MCLCVRRVVLHIQHDDQQDDEHAHHNMPCIETIAGQVRFAWVRTSGRTRCRKLETQLLLEETQSCSKA